MAYARNDLARQRKRIVFLAARGAHVDSYLRVALVDEERSAVSPRRIVPRSFHAADAPGEATQRFAHHVAASPVREHREMLSIDSPVHARVASGVGGVGAITRAERRDRKRAHVRLGFSSREQGAGILRDASVGS